MTSLRQFTKLFFHLLECFKLCKKNKLFKKSCHKLKKNKIKVNYQMELRLII